MSTVDSAALEAFQLVAIQQQQQQAAHQVPVEPPMEGSSRLKVSLFLCD